MTPSERRTYAEGVEFRQVAEGQAMAAGYAAMFEKRSHPLPGFVEEIAPGAFTKTVAEADVRALWNHDPNALLGRANAGTLRLTQDERGLYYEVDLPDTTQGRDVAELLRRGDVTGSSFGFRAIEDSWGETDDGYPLRTLKEVALRDVGPVTFPAYSDSSAALRALSEERSIPLDQLVAAAEADELRSLIDHETMEALDEAGLTPPPQKRYRRLAI